MKLIISMILVLACCSTGRAQEAKTFTVTDQEAQIIFAALVKLPWETVNPILVKLDGQVKEQEKKSEAKKEKL